MGKAKEDKNKVLTVDDYESLYYDYDIRPLIITTDPEDYTIVRTAYEIPSEHIITIYSDIQKFYDSDIFPAHSTGFDIITPFFSLVAKDYINHLLSIYLKQDLSNPKTIGTLYHEGTISIFYSYNTNKQIEKKVNEFLKGIFGIVNPLLLLPDTILLYLKKCDYQSMPKLEKSLLNTLDLHFYFVKSKDQIHRFFMLIGYFIRKAIPNINLIVGGLLSDDFSEHDGLSEDYFMAIRNIYFTIMENDPITGPLFKFIINKTYYDSDYFKKEEFMADIEDMGFAMCYYLFGKNEENRRIIDSYYKNLESDLDELEYKYYLSVKKITNEVRSKEVINDVEINGFNMSDDDIDDVRLI